MKFFLKLCSYIITALAACVLTLLWVVRIGLPGQSKLDYLESLIRTMFIGEYDETRIEDAAAGAMVQALGDRWSYYIPADAYQAHVESEENAYVGIGITITSNEDGEGFSVLKVQEDGGAWEAGMQVGDVIVAADGQSTDGMDLNQLRSIIRGEEGTIVRVTVLREQQEITFEIQRRMILTEVVTSRMLEDGIGLIAIDNFDSRCAQDSIAAIESLREAGATSLIFDVRFNPGGFADELVKLLDYLLPEGDLFRTVDYSGREHLDTSGASFLDMPICVLCNGESYSAAEFFAAAIQEYEAGKVIGTQTCGKGYFQYTLKMPDGSAVGLSVGKYFTPKGETLIGKGVEPDIIVELDQETYSDLYYGLLAPEEDPQIQAAVDYLKGEMK